ncbi:hypothetical protein A2215_02580 [Candidatus Berkelbacteria bacterium RIFOXYA2_FULL_43_10]|uniref:Transposase IS200-like domain-containing protein n=1 Tax=Candidatus Berkelbacteria bacterium RIFOXYA2_FULL_43_10 TaxID=1797472 RepID=A0A1F5E6G8_9BACT|nr:MAG: hypothetical protein A2215_02580 [Candidatus Berkelbacteria bacterium RIFOXYA2_FULL_43_10]
MSPQRKEELINNQIYHVFSRSIAEFTVFNNVSEFERMYCLVDLFRYNGFEYRYSQFKQLDKDTQHNIIDQIREENTKIVEIIAYCLMPTHFHFILKQISDGSIAKYIARVLNGYSKYFNTKHRRLGPLWASRFKNVLVKDDEQLLHLTRYIHLNPTSAGLVKNPEDWMFSSYGQYIQSNLSENEGICNYENLINIKPDAYKKFVNDRKNYQRDLALIKGKLLDKYSD